MLLTSLHPKSPDLADAVRIGEDSWGRGDLVGAATAAAERIGGASGPIAVLARPSIDTVLAVVAGLIAGVPIVPVPADVGIAERRHILADSAAVAWLGESPDESEGLPHVPVRRHARSWHQYSEPNPESTALIVYTSGTTGATKGVRLSRRALAASLDGLADAWEWTADDVLVHGLPLFHVHGLVLGLLGSLRVGNRFVHTVKPTPEAYAAARGSLYFGVPTVWSRVAGDESCARALSTARLLVSGSAPLPVPVFDELCRLTGHAPIERYGATETVITLSTRADGERRAGWVGHPLTGVGPVCWQRMGLRPPTTGKPWASCRFRAPHYSVAITTCPKTAEVLTEDGWYRTGDVAVIDAGECTASSAANRSTSSSPAATESAPVKSRPCC